ncbi:MAG: hypothetical protein NT121_01975 [Chloroflexi bacterium]|nr:hypothetical protein [Chloroflexota bacterium]
MKKILPYVLFVIGFMLVAGAGFYAWHTSQPQNTGSAGANVPQAMAGYPLSQSLTGAEALASIKQLHGVDFPLASGLVAEYGQKNATLWLAETSSDAQAAELVKSMEARIAQGGTTFTPMSVVQFSGHDVYMLDNQGEFNFYFQSGAKVIWLAIDTAKAEQAMKELLAFYP